MKKSLWFCLLFASFNIYADTASDVRKTIAANIIFTTEENIQGAMGAIHTEALSYASSKRIMVPLFLTYDLKYTLVSYEFIGSDGEYAYAKVTQRTEKINGPEFRDHELQVLHVLKKENGVWKFWAQANLAVKYL